MYFVFGGQYQQSFYRVGSAAFWRKFGKYMLKRPAGKACGAKFVLCTYTAFALEQRINHEEP